MCPKRPEARSDDLFRSSLEAIIDPAQELIRLAALIDWGRFDDTFGTHYHEAKGRRGLPTRLIARLHLLKHMKGLSDEETCVAWLETRIFRRSAARRISSTGCRLIDHPSPAGGSGSELARWKFCWPKASWWQSRPRL